MARTAAPLPAKHSVLGVGISSTSYKEVMSLCRHWIGLRPQASRSTGAADGPGAERGHCIFICTVNAVMTAVFQPAFRRLLNAGDLATTDGMPLAWALRSFGVKGQPRVYGPSLMLALCGQACRLGHRVFLFGGREEVLPRLQLRLERGFPGLKIAGTFARRDPPHGAEDDAWVAAIQDSQADLVFVGFGQPRQEQWILDHRDRLPGVVMIGVGAAFDFHAGRVRQAPGWMQRAGLEWLFRLRMEPRRLWRRYVLLNPLFLAMWGMQLLGILRYPKASRI